MTYRTEEDSLGTLRVPSKAYYGIQTFRAVHNFPISRLRLPEEMIRAYGHIKQAAAYANGSVKRLSPRLSRAIQRAAGEIIRGKFDDSFVVDVYQAGAGTSYNMNANEVIANRANELLGSRKGTYRPVHPNDHVNMAQSTNDTFPTAIQLACLIRLPSLLESMKVLEASLRRKAVQFSGIVKSGRTHLQDAVPVRLGGEFKAYAVAIRKAREAIDQSARALRELNLGGTATGTGMNAHPRYRASAIRKLSRELKIPLRPAENLHERMQSLADFARLSGCLRAYALDLIRISNDLRLLSSGPNTGLAEITLPSVQPGSSIMPGKVNPVIAEMANMVGFQVLGHDQTVAMAVQAGQLELNVMMPVIAYNLLQPMAILANASRVLAKRCVDGIKANPEQCRDWAERSLALVTALNHRIGYQKAALIAKESLKTRKSLAELVVAHGLLSSKEALRVLDPRRLS